MESAVCSCGCAAGASVASLGGLRLGFGQQAHGEPHGGHGHAEAAGAPHVRAHAQQQHIQGQWGQHRWRVARLLRSREPIGPVWWQSWPAVVISRAWRRRPECGDASGGGGGGSVVGAGVRDLGKVPHVRQRRAMVADADAAAHEQLQHLAGAAAPCGPRRCGRPAAAPRALQRKQDGVELRQRGRIQGRRGSLAATIWVAGLLLLRLRPRRKARGKDVEGVVQHRAPIVVAAPTCPHAQTPRAQAAAASRGSSSTVSVPAGGTGPQQARVDEVRAGAQVGGQKPQTAGAGRQQAQALLDRCIHPAPTFLCSWCSSSCTRGDMASSAQVLKSAKRVVSAAAIMPCSSEMAEWRSSVALRAQEGRRRVDGRRWPCGVR
ncbi:hypothetical protein TSOC_002085 [Tetrabaena socialis]|uniref:Uncharacterized protein n=1 Tax=Tetrabaena socialis TaxID=47790 RepID=A0A2J8AF30_9CHLO|nr:hypothetical protein TSOC_002085 [Tetrabaena socialis]|eukprot:PNH11119.1 hypothetical protein TSOC_002085 [Tetrabaena socialis]